MPPMGIPREPVRSYSTNFERDEEPIDEGGMWLNGGKDGTDWVDVMTKGGVCYGAKSRMGVPEKRAEQGNLDASAEGALPEGDYDDPTAVLTGDWGPDQHVVATVFSRDPSNEYFQEVEIRLRSTITPNSCTGYEVFWRCLKTDEGYAEIVRWNGKIGDFTSLARRTGPEFGVKDGDQVEATIVGNVITSYVNGVEVLQATDDTFADGAPGVGFNFGVGDTNVDHGFTSFVVDTYEPE
jgi:hypothetical protein